MRHHHILALALAGAVSGLPARAQGAEGPEDFATLSREFEATQKRYYAASRKLSDNPDYKQAIEARDSERMTEIRAALQTEVGYDIPAFGRRFAAAAAAHAGTEAAVPYLCWITQNSTDSEQVAAAMTTLVGDHVESAGLLATLERPYRPFNGTRPDVALPMLERIAAATPHDLVRAHALWHIAFLSGGQRAKDPETVAKVEAWLAEAKKLAAGRDLELRIDAPAFEKERLQIGMVAPDIEGEDMDGVPFKLSDYRGQVVVLDFWGFW